MTTDASTAGEPTRRLSSLRALWPFLRPYRRAVGGALLFLLLSTTASLILPAASSAAKRAGIAPPSR